MELSADTPLANDITDLNSGALTPHLRCSVWLCVIPGRFSVSSFRKVAGSD